MSDVVKGGAQGVALAMYACGKTLRVLPPGPLPCDRVGQHDAENANGA